MDRRSFCAIWDSNIRHLIIDCIWISADAVYVIITRHTSHHIHRSKIRDMQFLNSKKIEFKKSLKLIKPRSPYSTVDRYQVLDFTGVLGVKLYCICIVCTRKPAFIKHIKQILLQFLHSIQLF